VVVRLAIWIGAGRLRSRHEVSVTRPRCGAPTLSFYIFPVSVAVGQGWVLAGRNCSSMSDRDAGVVRDLLQDPRVD
jgi:hypothetical protein